MKKFLLILNFLGTFGAVATNAQTNAQTVYVTVAPSGSCQTRANVRLLVPNGTIYTCQSNVWAIGGGSGSGTVTSVSGTANQIGVATGTTTPVISLVTNTAIPGNPTTTTQSANNNSTRIATTAYVDGIGAATKAGVQAGGYLYCNSASSANTYSCALTPTLTAYTAGMCVILNVTNVNTTASTLNIDTLGAKAINTSNNVAIGAGAITALALYQVCYDGTEFLMPQDTSGPGGVTTVTISGSNALNGKYFFQKLTLSGNVTISSITNIKAGIYAFVICQNGSGNFTYTWPASVIGGMTVGLTASECNTQNFNSDGTTLYANSVGVINE